VQRNGTVQVIASDPRDAAKLPVIADFVSLAKLKQTAERYLGQRVTHAGARRQCPPR